MSRIGANFPRSTLIGASDQLLSSLNRSQADFLRSQAAISSGRTVNRPSDDSARTNVILMLENQIQAREQHDRNLLHGVGVLNFTDQSLNDVTDALIEAHAIASSQIGIGSNAQTRASESTVIDGMIQGLLEVVNRQFQGVSLFGGSGGRTRHAPAFQEFLGGIRYVGGQENLTNDLGLRNPLGFNSNGGEAFGALSNRVHSQVDLDPQATSATRLIDVNGAQGESVRLGSVVVTVDGSPLVVDLVSADTLGDVVTRINDAITQIAPAAGTLSVSGSGFELLANAGHAVSINELGAGEAAADLGILISASGTTVAGDDVAPRLTTLSKLSALGVAIDWTSGLQVSQGAVTRVADFSASTTVQDLQNEIDRLDLGLRLQINADGTGLNLISEVSGIALSVGEVAGGTTAGDLGLRTFGSDTSLSDFRFGVGVEVQKGEDDFALHLHDGRSFNVRLDGLTTVDHVIDAIAAAAAAAGISVGVPGRVDTALNVGLTPDGNGFRFEDNSAGDDDFRVTQLGLSLAATHLGIYQNAGSVGVINGEDVAKVRTDSIFTHMIDLRDGLLKEDSAGITFAGESIESDIEKLVKVRADVGVRAKQFEQQQVRSDELKITELTMLSDIRDTDLTSAIMEFVRLEQQLQASLQVGAQRLQLSFLDFLR